MSEQLAITTVMLGACFGIGWIAWVVATNIRRSKTAKSQAEVQARLLDKFGSGRDLIEYMQTDAGRRFVESVAIDRVNPFGRILGSIQVGLILTLLGLAFLLMRAKVTDPDALLWGTLTAISVLVWEWPQLSSWLDGLKLVLRQTASPSSRPPTDLFAFIGGGLVLFLFAILITLYASWAEE